MGLRLVRAAETGSVPGGVRDRSGKPQPVEQRPRGATGDPVIGRLGRPTGSPLRMAAPVHAGMAAKPTAGTAAAEAIIRENRASAESAQTLPAGDLRLVFAIDVARALQGGRSAILTPDRRQRLVEGANRSGLKPFDANLVIAMVQSAARDGALLSVNDVREGLSPGLRLVHTSVNQEHAKAPVTASMKVARLIVATLALAGAIFMCLRWVLSS